MHIWMEHLRPTRPWAHYSAHTLFSFLGLSHKSLWRQDKARAVCVSIPVCVNVCVSMCICAPHKLGGKHGTTSGRFNCNILSASLSAHFEGKHLGLGIIQLIVSLLCSLQDRRNYLYSIKTFHISKTSRAFHCQFYFHPCYTS